MLVFAALLALLVRYLVHGHLTGLYPGLPSFLRRTCIWDCGLYRLVAEGGYEPESSDPTGLSVTWAFFPLRPLLDGLLMRLTGLYYEAASFLMSTALAIAAAVVARPLFHHPQGGWLFGFYLLVGPLAPILSTGYTETLFMLLTIVALRSIRQGRYVSAGVAAGLLSATRLPGIAMGLAILTHAVWTHLRTGGSLLSFFSVSVKNWRLALGLLLCPMGLLAFMAHLHFVTGDALAFLHAQALWGRSVNWPWHTVLDAVQNLWPGRSDLLRAVHSVSLLAGLALCVVLAVRRQVAEATFCFTVLMIAAAGGLTSVTRFVLGLAPIAILAIDSVPAPAPFRTAALLGCFALGILSTYGWLAGYNFLV